MIGEVLNNRYRIEAEIGQGGMGTVYRGYDTALERRVAIKVLSRIELGTEGRGRLLSEAQMVAKLNHPNIVTVYDVGEEKETPFIVMEYVEGKSLDNQPPENIGETLEIMRQVCAALEHAHEQGVIHRDLKPENVIVTESGTAKLMDFGLARSVASRYTTEGLVSGTVFYLAPEQALGQEIDPRTDLYSLGVMLYELTTGELPFMDQDPIAVISQHLHAPVVPPRAKNDEVTRTLNELILRLMNKEQRDRPASAREVLQTLEAIGTGWIDIERVEELSLLDRIVRGRMVGRERELLQARQLWQNAVSGEGQLLLISGEPGIGKTRLMREITTLAEVSEGQVFIGECQAEGNAPYAPFAQLTRRALRANRDNGMELPKPVLADLLALSPDLSIDYPGVEQNPRLDPEAEQVRLFEHVVRFCDILSQEAPLLMILEDMHWADSGSLHMLEHLARRTRQQPVMLLGTYREVELDEALSFHETLLGLTRRRLGQRVKLERLDKEKTRDLLAVIFAEGIKPEFLEGIYKETEGNPFFIEEVCKALVESGEVWYEGGSWQRAPDMADVTIPQGIKIAIQSRVSKLTKETQSVLLTAAVIGREFDYQTLHMVSGKSEDTLIDNLEEAIGKQLIEEAKEGGGGLFSFTHALIPSTLRESISGLRRTRLHRQVATAIEELHLEDYERLAYHWGEAGDEDRGLEYTIRAAERAQMAYANEDAIRLFSEALALVPEDNPDRFDLLAGRAAVFGVIGEVNEQLADVEAMLKLAESEGDDARRIDALLALANVYLDSRRTRVREPAEQTLKIAREMGDAGSEGRALYCLGGLAHRMGEHEDARQYFEESVKCLRKAGLTHELIESLSYLSVMFGRLGNDSAAIEAAQEAVDLCKQVGDRLLEAQTMRRLGIAYMNTYRYAEALPIAEEALRLHRELGDISGEIAALNVLGIVKQRLEMLEEAEADYLEGIRIAESINQETGILWLTWNLCWLYDWNLGQYEKAMDLIQEHLKTALLGGNKSLIIDLQDTKAYYYYLMGRFEEALSLEESILPDFEELMDIGLQASLLSFLGLIYAELGQFEQAHQYLQSALERGSGLKGYLTDWRIQLNYALSAVLEKETSNLLVSWEHAKRAVVYAQEHKSMGRIGAALLVKACIHLALLDEGPFHAKAALECTEGALKHIAVEPGYVLMPENFLFQHSRALRVNGREEEADETLRQAYERVMLVAGNFTNEDYRRSYLENVCHNREILAAYQERFG